MRIRKFVLGFVAAAFVLTMFSAVGGHSTYAAEKAVVTTGSNVRLRSSASTAGTDNIITSLPKGAILTETGRSGEWASVKYNGQTGFVNTQFIAEAAAGSAAAGPGAGNSGAANAGAGAGNSGVNNAGAGNAAGINVAAVPSAGGGGHIVCIDPGHQGKGDSTPEPIGPGSSTTKARVAGGTHGTTSGLKEYQLTLSVGELLRNELSARGYTVYMTRTSHDVNISNMERAQYATSVGAEITVRLHANGANSASTSGALALAPSASNPYVGNLAASSQLLSSKVLSSYCAATGFANKGVQANDSMTGINWCTQPVTIIEMGFMTNPSDDLNMANPDFQKKMAAGIANGIDSYFN